MLLAAFNAALSPDLHRYDTNQGLYLHQQQQACTCPSKMSSLFKQIGLHMLPATSEMMLRNRSQIAVTVPATAAAAARAGMVW
jgi:hypothetical protein